MNIEHPKYRFKRAIRPFSYSVAIVTIGLGILLASKLSQAELMPNAFLLILAGLFLQAGVNLINDYTDLANDKIFPTLTENDIHHIRSNNKVGWVCMMSASLIGLYLVYVSGLFLLGLAIFGGLGAIFYTTEPIHYKRRGLGVILVFFYMGVLMVYGSWFALTSTHNLDIILYSLPVSCLTSALLLSNELRDYQSDIKEHLHTLSIRIGFNPARVLYVSLVILPFLLLTPFYLKGLITFPIIFLLPLALSFIAIKKLIKLPEDGMTLPPFTGKLYMVFGLSLLLSLSI